MSSSLTKLLLGSAIILALVRGFYVIYNHNQPVVSRDTVFIVKKGEGLSAISQNLTTDGLVSINGTVFKAMALITKYKGSIKAGQYQLIEGMSGQEILSLFRLGKVIHYNIMFPEGLSVGEWLSILQDSPHLEVKTAGLKIHEVALALGLSMPLEGLLFPDTYSYILGDSDLDILRRAVTQMNEVLEKEWGDRTNASLLNPREALILASIIEKETGYGPDRTKVASVFHNRLKTGMRLQSEPTVIFGLGKLFDGDLKRSHLKTDTPYNTYTRAGLPPGPICSPGMASINAALRASSHPYFYFVAMGNGKSFFSVSLSEHNQAVNRYQKGQKR